MAAVECRFCGREHPHDRAMRKHIHRLHEAELPFGCAICGRRFDSLRALNTHQGYRHPSDYSNRRNDPRVQRDWNLRKNYGIGVADYEALLRAQGYRCATCGRLHDPSLRSRILHVDHDHTTGAVRGLLCAQCNHVLGKVEDNIELLLTLALYLERHRG